MSKQKTSSKPSKTFRYCAQKPTLPRQFSANVNPTRAAMIVESGKKWVNGTTLNYWFFDGPDTQKKAMRKAFKTWMDLGIGISFVEVTDRDASHIRVSFEDDGSWSNIGRDILTVSKSEATLNIGWDISTDIDTGVHEIGHTLGMPHEHQNPNAGIVWNEEAVYASLAKPPNKWDRDKTFWNIIRKIPASQVTGTTWDPDSIMHYPFEAGLIVKPAKYFSVGLTPAGGLSPKDIGWIKKVYPKLPSAMPTLQAFTTKEVVAKSGDQANFHFEPTETRRYTVRMFGKTDAVLVLFEEGNNTQTYLAGTDDSGEDHNGELTVKLEKGKTYSVRIRVMYREPDANCAVMVW